MRGPEPAIHLTAGGGGGGALKPRRPVWSAEKDGFVEADVIDRYRLAPGDTVTGPAVVEERESSVVIGVGGRGALDRHGNLRVELDA